jgi:predicted phage terminase large subunit-like protein
VPRTGGMFPRDWWAHYDQLPPGVTTYLQSWDLAFKNSDGSDYVVGLVAARLGAYVYLVDRFKQKVSFVDTCDGIRTMAQRYPSCAVLIEDAANGPAVVDTLQREIVGLIAVKPEGGKESRAAAVQPLIEAKQVLLPHPYGPDGRPRADRLPVPDFIDTCTAFPKGAHDDDVDALTQLLVYFQQHAAYGPLREILPTTADFGPKLFDGLDWAITPSQNL